MEYSLFKGFVSRVLRLSHIHMDIILVALAHVDKMKLSRVLEYGPGTHERVFIGALILATKVCMPLLCLSEAKRTDRLFVVYK